MEGCYKNGFACIFLLSVLAQALEGKKVELHTKTWFGLVWFDFFSQQLTFTGKVTLEKVFLTWVIEAKFIF